jgi:hypothetical protein
MSTTSSVHSRRVHLLGTTPYPDEAFVIQTLRQVTGCTPQKVMRWPVYNKHSDSNRLRTVSSPHVLRTAIALLVDLFARCG